jgi:hypothetical protein
MSLARYRTTFRRTRFLSVAVIFVVLPHSVRAWGRNGNKLVVNKAIDTLPAEIRAFFESNRALLSQHVTDPLDTIATKAAERHNHFLYLDKYGRFPYDALPRNYKAAVNKYGKTKVQANGLLPWHWEEAKLDAAILANYVAEAHDPFNTTEDFDGHLTGQTGIDERFGTTLIDRYSSFFPMRPNDATFISDPTDHAFEACLSSHSWLETILLADRNSKHGENSYNDEYFDHFYNAAAVTLIRQLSDAATDVGSYWLTAWVNAGRPQLPH